MSLYNFMFAESSTLENPWFLDGKTGHKLTGAEVKGRTDALARGLADVLELGSIRPGTSPADLDHGIRDVVALVSPNCLDFGVVVWAVHKLGCTVASINGGSTAQEIKYQCSLSGTRTIFAHIDCLEKVIMAAEELALPLGRIVVIADSTDCGVPSESQAKGLLTAEALIHMRQEQPLANPISYFSPTAFLCFSSGTTGLPKAVVVPHSAVIANITQLENSCVPAARAGPGDRALGLIPFSHMFGLVTLLHLCPHLGVTTVAFKSMPTFEDLLATISHLQVAHLFLVPYLVNAFIKHPATPRYNLKFLKTAMIAAAPLDSRSECEFQNLGGSDFLVTQGFGMTECCGLITGLPAGTPPRPGSVGRVLQFTEAKIIDEYGNCMSPGHRGQLCVRGPQLCSGYFSNTEATQNAFDADGFFLTGDIAEITEDGYIYIVDRLKSMIKHKGYQVSPAELEAHLLSLDSVHDAGVVGCPNSWSGEVPIAFIVLSAAGNLAAERDLHTVTEAIKISVQENKSHYKWLHGIIVVPEIPRLPSGKILRARLKQMLEVPNIDISTA